MEKHRTNPVMNRWFITEIRLRFVSDLMQITVFDVFSIFFMQPGGRLIRRYQADLPVVQNLPSQRLWFKPEASFIIVLLFEFDQTVDQNIDQFIKVYNSNSHAFSWTVIADSSLATLKRIMQYILEHNDRF
jgi:hypothetical protein